MTRLPVIVAAVLAGAAVLVACGGDDRAAPALTGAAADGEALVAARGCLSCHSTDGSSGTGPSWEGLYGSQVRLSDGSTVLADRDYLRRAILDPDAEAVDGFPAGLMRSAVPAGSLTDAEVVAIVAYLETLGNRDTDSGD